MQNPSKSLFSLGATGVLAAALLTTPLFAQEPETGRRPATPETQRAGDPGGQRQGDAQQRPSEILDQAAVIGARVSNGKKDDGVVEYGEIADLVIDARSGEVRYAILAIEAPSAAGKKSALPWGRLTHDGERAFVLSMQPDELASLPAFEPKKLQLLGRGASDGAPVTGAKGTGDNTSGKTSGNTSGGAVRAGQPADASTAAEPEATLALASWIADCTVMAGSDEFGAGASVLIDPARGTAPFVTVPVEGERAPLVVPWQALRLQQGEDEERTLVLSKSRAELGAAPRLAGEHANLGDAAVRKAIHAFYGTKEPAAGKQHAERGSADGSPGGSSGGALPGRRDEQGRGGR